MLQALSPARRRRRTRKQASRHHGEEAVGEKAARRTYESSGDARGHQHPRNPAGLPTQHLPSARMPVKARSIPSPSLPPTATPLTRLAARTPLSDGARARFRKPQKPAGAAGWLPDPVIAAPRLRKGSVIAANEVPLCRFAPRIKKVQANPPSSPWCHCAGARAAQTNTILRPTGPYPTLPPATSEHTQPLLPKPCFV